MALSSLDYWAKDRFSSPGRDLGSPRHHSWKEFESHTSYRHLRKGPRELMETQAGAIVVGCYALKVTRLLERTKEGNEWAVSTSGVPKIPTPLPHTQKGLEREKHHGQTIGTAAIWEVEKVVVASAAVAQSADMPTRGCLTRRSSSTFCRAIWDPLGIPFPGPAKGTTSLQHIFASRSASPRERSNVEAQQDLFSVGRSKG